jgi:hypothetical protein
MSTLPISLRRVLTIAGILVLVLMVIDFNRRIEALNTLNKQAAEVRVRGTQAMQTTVALQTQLAYAGSTAAVEDWARSEGHFAREGDRPVVPIGQPGSEPIQEAEPTPLPTPMPNWQVWWNLFFGER